MKMAKKQKQKKSLYVEDSKVEYWGKPLKYVMPQKMFDAMTEECPKGTSPDQYVIQTLNESYGLLGHVTEISITEE